MTRGHVRGGCTACGYTFSICKARRRKGKPRGFDVDVDVTPRRFTLDYSLGAIIDSGTGDGLGPSPGLGAVGAVGAVGIAPPVLVPAF